MPKSIHERVRAALEKKAREDKRAADRVSDAALRRQMRDDEEYERGAEWAHEGHMSPPPRASKEFRDGFKAGCDADLREMLGE